ncbi:MAG: cobyrinate a,c-diamide synthase [Firmicutes bacterium]|nr:cobyrinate a,c-diamide synthase [Bacillota bacterium]
MKRLLIAGTNSGVGKTTITAGVIAALRRRGQRVIPFKVGPDYIDPGFHAAAAGVAAGNLDSWMVPPAQVLETLQRRVPSDAIAIIEGVMGLYDGRKNEGELGSSAHVAKITDTPVVLVASGAKMARSAAALIGGYIHFDRDVNFAGVIFNHVGSASHYQILAEAVTHHVQIPLLGWLPNDTTISIPERHLGLMPTTETDNLQILVEKLADMAEAHLDLDSLLAAAASASALPPMTHKVFPVQSTPVTCRIAIAKDEAFHFYYQENLNLLASYGAELVPFSPIHDQELPHNCHGLILGGGFPEMYASQLAANRHLCTVIKEKVADGMPVYAECGGYMYLSHSLTTFAGETYPMCGIFPGRAVMRSGRRALGYVEVAGTPNNDLLLPQESCRGHEFHWSDMEDVGTTPIFLNRSTKSHIGERIHNCVGSYIHLHFLGQPTMAQRLVTNCTKYARRATPC